MNALDVVYALGGAALAPVWARKARGGWRERIGHVEKLPAPAPGARRLLIHGVSVGEINALRELVPMLAESEQGGGARTEVVVCAGTDTGLARAQALFGARHAVRRYPLDFSASVARFLDAVQPHAVALCELEVWPNFIGACSARAVPVAVINGRLSERSFRGYRRLRPVLGRTFARLALAAAQDEAYRERFVAMGVEPARARVTGTMKWDTVKISADAQADAHEMAAGADELARALGIDRARPLIVAGSTGPGEEALLHEACPPGVQLLCAPRKPERFDEAARALPGCTRRSWSRPGPGGASRRPGGALALPTSRARFLLDTIGELRSAYALADVAIVGRSFGAQHGSDPIEPVALGRATVIGPAHSDFATIVGALRRAGGIEVVSAGELRRALTELLENPARRERLARNGRACVREQQGATRRHAQLLLELLHGSKG
jgi:3-deoxy-D-manno-octulosonic-acid transferase